LQRLSRRIAHFLGDHKVFKSFIFLGCNYQKTILKYSKILAKLLRLALNKAKKTASAMYQNPFVDETAEFLQFGTKKVDVDIGEPNQEQLALFTAVEYFNGDTQFLPYVNTDYGEGRYDGRFDNKEFFKEKVNLKTYTFLKMKQEETNQKP